MNINKKFPEKRVIITGAGSGLGRSLSLKFAELGWNIAVTDINIERMKETEKLVIDAGGKALTYLCDVTKPDDFNRLRDMVKNTWGGVDILINNAGIVTGGFMEKVSLNDWDWIIDVNLKSVIYGCRTFIPVFKEQRGGYIVNVASSAGIASLPELSPYNVSKAAVISLSETLRIELLPDNIGITVSCPTFFKTNLLENFSSTDVRQRSMANNFFAKTKTSSGMIADHIMKSVSKGRLYSIQQSDGKALWFLKRHCPEWFFKFFAWSYKKGYYDKYIVGL